MGEVAEITYMPTVTLDNESSLEKSFSPICLHNEFFCVVIPCLVSPFEWTSDIVLDLSEVYPSSIPAMEDNIFLMDFIQVNFSVIQDLPVCRRKIIVQHDLQVIGLCPAPFLWRCCQLNQRSRGAWFRHFTLKDNAILDKQVSNKNLRNHCSFVPGASMDNLIHFSICNLFSLNRVDSAPLPPSKVGIILKKMLNGSRMLKRSDAHKTNPNLYLH